MATRKVVGFLQNAWSPLYAGTTWPRDSWLRALHRSRSGQRLRILIQACPDHEFWWDNTTSLVGETPDSVIAPDDGHIRQVLKEQKGAMVLTLGRQAFEAVRPHVSTVLALPHPAYRVVTNLLFLDAGRLIREGFEGQMRLSQARSMVTMERVQ